MSFRSMGAIALAAALVAGQPAAAQTAAPARAPAGAASPKAAALVRRYMAAIHFERTMDSMQAAMLPMIGEDAAKRAGNLTPADQQLVVEAVRTVMREKVMPRMIDRIVPIYATTFTDSELEALVAFYESPTGRSITDKIPGLAPKTAEVVRELMPDMRREMILEMCARISCAAAPPAPPTAS